MLGMDYSCCLYAGWVQHNTDLSSDGLWRKVASESASDNSIGSVRSADLAPVNSEFVSELVGGFSLGDEGNLLSEVKVNIILGVDSLNFDQTDTVVLGSKTTLVTKDGTVNMKLWRSWGHDYF